MMFDLTETDKIIVGRVEPYIYAFSTNTFPNYLKVGDTYRSVIERLNEWKKHFPNLQKEFEETAKINESIFFRDHSIHKFLIDEKHKDRLSSSDVPDGVYFSNEFFKDTEVSDVREAIADIKDSFAKKDNKYSLYNVQTALPEIFSFDRVEDFEPRPNQYKTIENFKKAVKKGRKKLLMYAVMRFGKSFTSMCCATEINSKLVVVVSAKADVKMEWKKTVESHKKFEGYLFLTSDDLRRDNKIITKHLKDNKKVVAFLTLQDLQGTELKEKHKDIFKKKIDLLIIDETHFGARAEQYGKVLLSKEEIKATMHKKDNDDYVDIKEADEQIKFLDAKIKLHLSGTPYRILMGSEFTKDDVIAFYQFSDIVDDQEEWNKKYLLDDNYKEWDNPYYGFPQMIRFAFNPNESSRKKIEQLKQSGITGALSELLRPLSIVKDDQTKLHKKFKNEEEVLDLFRVIDGSKEDNNVLGFLNYNKIKEGNMCRHIVCVLPYCASCDALENLINEHQDEFLNLNEYEIINISGVEYPNNYNSSKDIKNKIKECEDNNKKTITLTVNRMLTGSTVEYWDTMIYLKNTTSPQEYDQAIFRLQNQYIRKYQNENGDVIKYNMKPQTLLVDFDPTRLFQMQEQKAQIYNVNIDESGNSKLAERLQRELEISPIIVLNKNKMERITPIDIMREISNYSKNKGVVDEASSLPVDLGLMNIDEILKEIAAQGKLGSKEGLSFKPAIESGNDLDTPASTTESDSDETDQQENSNVSNNKEEIDVYKDFKEKFKTYYARILFFAFLTNSTVKSVDDIISVMDKLENKRISKNLSLDKGILKIIRKNINKFCLSQLDYKIQNLNDLSKDTSLEPLERAKNAIAKFDRLSISEIVTSQNLCDDMVGLIPESDMIAFFENNRPILDIASKSAEFAISIYNKYVNKLDINKLNNMIYSIPTSSHTYEFTRKIYQILGLNISNISANFNTYDLLNYKKSNGEIDYDNIVKVLTQNISFDKLKLQGKIKGGKKMKFSAIVGNPPYQVSDGGAQASSKPIYNYFVNISKALSPNYISIITPTRWFAGGKGLDDFRDDMINDGRIQILHDYLNPSLLFPNTNIRGGVCYFLWNKIYDNKKELVEVVTHDDNYLNSIKRPMKYEDVDIFIRDGRSFSIINKISEKEELYMNEYVSTRKPFGFEGFFINDLNYKTTKEGLKDYVVCIGKGKKIGYVDKNLVQQNVQWIDKYKVFIPRANNIGTELNDDNLNAFVGEPNVICTESYLVIGANLNLSKEQVNNLIKYMKTKFVRFLHSLAKASQDATSKTFKFVPLQEFNNDFDINWDNTIDDINSQLYKKYNLSSDEIEYIESMIKSMD